MSQPTVPIDIRQFKNGVWSTEQGSTPAEMPVMLTVNGEPWLEFMCTPEYLEALAVGFLYNEGLIDSATGVANMRICPAGDNVDIWTVDPIEKPIRWRRTSGCSGGITANEYNLEFGETELPALPTKGTEYLDDVILTASQITKLVIGLFQEQRLHRKTGGIHASAMSDGNELLLFCEDIGRHNTLDKLAGRILMETVGGPRRAVLTTGRISSEMLQKAARMGTAIVISCTAPMSLAVQMADAWGMTLIGYAQRDRFVVYTHSERIRP
jgi:FdhD protein